MTKYITSCTVCNKIYKCNKQDNNYITDFNDNLTQDGCVICGNKDFTAIPTEDWIADLVFIVKGK